MTMHAQLLRSRALSALGALLLAGALAAPLSAQQTIEPNQYGALTWRNVGPFRGGRVGAVTGVIGEPGTFYAGFPGGGVWKTTSAGQTWYPIFDSIKDVSSVGAIEVAPSDPNVIYVGTGDQITGGTLDQGNGVYKSADAGKTWQHLGLEQTRHISSIVVDPHDPNVVLIGALGEAMRKNDARGVFRSTDGGRTWAKTLYIDDATGVAKLARAFDVPDVIFATTMPHYAPPDYAQDRIRTSQLGATPAGASGVYKSTDGGVTWHQLSGGGLPAQLTGRMAIAVAMRTNAQRVYLVTNNALWRSDDGGTTWRHMDPTDDRIRNGQGGYNRGVDVDPQNPDVVYTLSTATYKSIDGGNTFTGFRGAPGGDDAQAMWIDPTNGRRILLGYDQGLIVSLDGGDNWSSWYNQSTEQVYHVSTDNSFPYWVYAAQQDAGAIRTRSRGNNGAITMFDWGSVNGWEWGTVVADPLNPNYVYASGGGIVKISYPSEQWINVSPAIDPAAKARATSSMPLIWAPWDQHELIAGLNFVTTTIDGGAHWTRISGDLGVPPGLDSAALSKTVNGRGAIESLAASSVARGVIWTGSSNGLIHVTRDEGKTWADVSIPGIPNARRANISAIDASTHDAGTAYVAIEYLRQGDYAPYLYRTRDFGKTWTKIVNGMPTGEAGGSFTRVIRTDPVRRGLLFAGTESGVHVSFDDGDHWQSLQQNLPDTPVRDITIKGNDLVIATHGRGIWILDDISMLRQLAATQVAERAHLYAPGEAVRVRRNTSADTPMPPDIPHALNPMQGAIIDYWLAAAPSGVVTLDVLDAGGKLVRHLSSAPQAPLPEAARPPHPNFWIAPPFVLPASAGENRTHWDLRYDDPPAFSHSFEINANPGLTPASPQGALAMPGEYTLRLTVDGRAYTQKVKVKNDPRSRAGALALAAQHALLMKITDGIHASWDGDQQAVALRAAAVKAAGADAPPEVKAAIAAFTAKVDAVAGGGGGRGFGRGGAAQPTFRGVNGALIGQLNAQDNADLAPNGPMMAAFAATCKELAATDARWTRVAGADLAALNTTLTKNGLAAVAAPALFSAPACR
ncbi:MAG: WD40/YVTN/BNR-like repeat-containing protein [Gemmatimonadaceae bacterium]